MVMLKRGGPLAGVRVIEITKVWAGPYAGKLLALLGAEVIKVESLANLDEMRAYGGVDIDSAPYFLSINQDVLSVQVNLKSAEGFELLRRLIAKSDVLLDNLRPGAMERAGLDYAGVCAIRPDIIQASLKMYGSDGPLGYQTGYAPCFAALGGLTALVGHESEAPAGMNIRYGDSTVGAQTAFAIIAALHHRETTGEGQFIDVSAVEAMSVMIGDSLFVHSATGEVRGADGNAHDEMAPHGVYRCRDGDWLSLAIATDTHWQALCKVIEIDPARFALVRDRLAGRGAVDSRVAEALAVLDADSTAHALRQAGVPAFRSMSSLDLVTDEQLWASGAFTMVTDGRGQSRPIVGPGWRLSPDPADVSRGAPLLGEHNAYVYGEILGLDDDDIARLKESRAIY